MKESARYILQILVFVALILSIGTGGYLVIEDGISVSDAFYMTVTAITPTQFDEVHKLSTPGRYFTVGLVFCGFGAVVAFATQFARLIIQSELEGVGVITRKQMRRRISRMRDHYIVCGYGKIGSAICADLQDQHLPFVVVTDDESSVDAVRRAGYPLVRGNPTADASLREAEIERAHGVIAVLADDSDNLFISLAARELNPKIFIIARGEDAGVEDRILRAGADIVVSPMKLGGRQIAELIKQQAGASTIVGSAAQSSVLGLSMTVYRHSATADTTVDKVLEDSTAIGVAGIERHDGSFEHNPSRDAIVNQGDSIALIMQTEETGDSFHKQPSGKTILLADDHRALRLLFSRKLAAAGHDVVQAATGEDALVLAHASTPDLIVLDVDMPKRNGYDVCAELRQSKEFTNVPIIIYSGDDTGEFMQRGWDSGADICIRKTSKSSELLASIEEVFAQRRTSGSDTRAPGESDESSRLDEKSEVEEGFDFAVAMENADGDRKLLGELVTVMLEETPQLMARITLATTERDLDPLRRAAHSLKGSLGVVGACQASSAAAKLESAAASRDIQSIDELHAELQRRVETVTRALRKQVV